MILLALAYQNDDFRVITSGKPKDTALCTTTLGHLGHEFGNGRPQIMLKILAISDLPDDLLALGGHCGACRHAPGCYHEAQDADNAEGGGYQDTYFLPCQRHHPLRLRSL